MYQSEERRSVSMERIIAESGGHLGKLLITCLKGNPDGICQIDAATGATETNASVLSRSIGLARSFQRAGLQPGDVLAVSGRNHLDLHIPHFAALLSGQPVNGVDALFKYDELKAIFKLTEPKIAFCETESYEIYLHVLKDLNLHTRVVTFGEGENSLAAFLEKYESNDEEEFQPAQFDKDKVFAWLVCTSGSTGGPKLAAITHQTVLEKLKIIAGADKSDYYNRPMELVLHLAVMQWITSYINPVGFVLRKQTKVQTSAPATPEHIIDIINKYKPVSILTSPAVLSSVLKCEKPCDFSCFKYVALGGNKSPPQLIQEIRSRLTNGTAWDLYGGTEILGPVILPRPGNPEGSSGKPVPPYKIKLVDPESNEDITEPNKNGELCVKGPRFTEYYKNPEDTAKAITADGWYKTGDIFYRDENDHYYYVERLKTMIKYKNNQIIPAELAEVILTHPSVRDVAVSSVPHPEDGERPVACVVLRDGATVTAGEIKELVANKLAPHKQLTGGVVFLQELPVTATGKIQLAALKQLVLDAHRE